MQSSMRQRAMEHSEMPAARLEGLWGLGAKTLRMLVKPAAAR
jgi:hypothetical protein